MKEPTVVSTFSGAGGSSLGYKMAGYKELLAIDFDSNAVQTFALNFPEIPVWKRNIKSVKSQEILDFCNIVPGELFLLDGSPPCQGFSLAGSREFNDPRNELFTEFVRLISDLKPKVFVMENVSAMASGSMKGKFVEILTKLKSTGYAVRAKIMDSMWYGVPQKRKRLIFIGTRDGSPPPFPTPGTKFISAAEALAGLPEDASCSLSERGLQMWLRAFPGTQFSKYNIKGHYFNAVKIHPNKPAPTISKSVSPKGYSGLFHWKYPRCLNIAEIKRLSGFPDDFVFIGIYSNQWARIGNAVMPKFMFAIAQKIKETLFVPEP